MNHIPAIVDNVRREQRTPRRYPSESSKTTTTAAPRSNKLTNPQYSIDTARSKKRKKEASRNYSMPRISRARPLNFIRQLFHISRLSLSLVIISISERVHRAQRRARVKSRDASARRRGHYPDELRARNKRAVRWLAVQPRGRKRLRRKAPFDRG